jgi:hypothetical protein
MVSNLLKRWQDDFVTVKRQRDGFGAFRKETGCHPVSSRPTSSTGSNEKKQEAGDYCIMRSFVI